MVNSSEIFSTYSPCPSNRKIVTTERSLIIIASIGNLHLTLILRNVLYVPRLATSLLSIRKLIDLGCKVLFCHNYGIIS